MSCLTSDPVAPRYWAAAVALTVACLPLAGCGGGNATGTSVQVSPEFQQKTAEINKNMAKDYAAARRAAAKKP